MKEMSPAHWEIIASNIKKGNYIPIINDRVYSYLLPNLSNLANAWAEYINYPLNHKHTITRLAQYMSVEHGNDTAKDVYLRFVKAYFIGQKRNLTPHQIITHPEARLDEADLAKFVMHLNASKNKVLKQQSLDILTKLPIPLFITTSHFKFIEYTLKKYGKTPDYEICAWNEKVKRTTLKEISTQQLSNLLSSSFNREELKNLCYDLSIDYEEIGGTVKKSMTRELLSYVERRERLDDLITYARKKRPHTNWPSLEALHNKIIRNGLIRKHKPSVFENEDYLPTANKPLVYHLFGAESDPQSIVLSEDNYIDYLIQLSQDDKLIHPIVSEYLTHSPLLLLGYKISDWDFRALFRGIISKRHETDREMSIAIQLDPEEYSPKAQTYLESYFDRVRFKVYWGSSEEFLNKVARF